MKCTQRRTASLGEAGAEITDAVEWCDAFATNDDDYAKLTEIYGLMNDEEKTWLAEVMMDESGDIFRDRDALASHFAGLSDDDKIEIRNEIQGKYAGML